MEPQPPSPAPQVVAPDGPLPADDPVIFTLDLRGLRRRWSGAEARTPISAEAMAGADRRAQAFGVPAQRLMEHAGTAVAAAVRSLAVDLGRWGSGPILILCGPGNNGGDGFVAARYLAGQGARVIVVFVVDDADRHAGPLQLPDGAAVAERDDADVIPGAIEPRHDVEDVFLRSAVGAGGEQLHDPDPVLARPKRARRLPTRVSGVRDGPLGRHASGPCRRTSSRRMGSSTAPHWYLYPSSPRRKSSRCRPWLMASRT